MTRKPRAPRPRRRRQYLDSCPDGCTGQHTVYVGQLEFSPGFFDVVRRASPTYSTSTGNVTPDKAKGRQLETDDLSAPAIPCDGTTGVDTKYSR